MINTNKCNLPQGWNGTYNPSIMLEETQVSAITQTILESKGLKNEEHYLVRQVGTSSDQYVVAAMQTRVEEMIGYVFDSKPGVLQISDNTHWNDIFILRFGEQIHLVSMDGNSGNITNNQNIQKIAAELKKQFGTAQLNVSNDVHDMNVKGQQHYNNCGLDTGLNAASVIETYYEYIKTHNSFDEVSFKQALDKKIHYQQKNGKYYIRGQETSLTKQDIVIAIGTDVLLRSAHPDELKKYKTRVPNGTFTDCLNRLIVPNQSVVQSSDENVQQPAVHHSNSTVSDSQKDAFYNQFNEFLKKEINQKLLAKYIKENNVINKIQPELTNNSLTQHPKLKENMKEVIKMANGDKNMSLGLINGLIIYLANLTGWNCFNVFTIVKEDTKARNFVNNWTQKVQIKNEVAQGKGIN